MLTIQNIIDFSMETLMVPIFFSVMWFLVFLAINWRECTDKGWHDVGKHRLFIFGQSILVGGVALVIVSSVKLLFIGGSGSPVYFAFIWIGFAILVLVGITYSKWKLR